MIDFRGLKSLATKWIVPYVPRVETLRYKMDRAYGTAKTHPQMYSTLIAPYGAAHVVARDFNPWKGGTAHVVATGFNPLYYIGSNG